MAEALNIKSGVCVVNDSGDLRDWDENGQENVIEQMGFARRCRPLDLDYLAAIERWQAGYLRKRGRCG